MIKFLKRFDWLLSLLFGIAVFLFFAFYYENHLYYQEQLQLFLFTSYYFSDLLGRPGGLADYLGTFFTQFYYYAWLGASFIAIILVILQLGIKSLCSKWKDDSLIVTPLTFIPSILFLGLLCDENCLLSAPISALMLVGAVLLYLRINIPNLRIICVFIMLPLLYWCAGGIFWLFGLFCILYEWRYFRQFAKTQWILLVLLTVGLTAFLPLITSQYLQYPLYRLWWGISYNRYPVISPYPLLVVWLSVISVPFLIGLINEKLKKISRIVPVFLAEIVLVVIFAIITVKMNADWKKEEIMAYDYCARIQDWQGIIRMANKKDPDSPLSVACLNLALYKDGSMSNSMFRYFQNGPEGLLPTFQRDFTSPLITGEVYYHLGFLNTSMRYSFEAMEALPDYKKSCRAMLRIAEVNMLNEEYKVAEKYLRILQHTLFYRKRADEMLRCLDNKERINENPEWVILKKYRLTDDFLFSENEKDQMLGLLFIHDRTNKMAFEYLMAYTLLIKDLEHFVQYCSLGKDLGYKEIPAHYQEALLFYWINSGQSLDALPWDINPAVISNYTNFVKALSSGMNTQALSDNFSQTYWYYLQFAGNEMSTYSQKPIY